MQVGKIEQHQIKTAKMLYGKYYCECGKKVVKGDNYCSKCGAKLKFIKCEHKEHYSESYIDYDRTYYEIYCCECNTKLANVSWSGYERAKKRFNIVKEN